MITLSLLIGLLLYILLAWFAVRMVGWLANVLAVTATTKRILQALCVAIFVLIPTWDIIPGRLYFQHLCEKEAGIKVFKMVEVDKSYLTPNGQPDKKRLSMSSNFVMVHKDDREYLPIFHIAKFESVLQDKQTSEVLGIDVHLAHYGGWLNAYLFPQGPPTKCAGYSPYRDVWTEVIKPKSASAEGGK